jgi:hypothetical protein
MKVAIHTVDMFMRFHSLDTLSSAMLTSSRWLKWHLESLRYFPRPWREVKRLAGCPSPQKVPLSASPRKRRVWLLAAAHWRWVEWGGRVAFFFRGYPPREKQRSTWVSICKGKSSATPASVGPGRCPPGWMRMLLIIPHEYGWWNEGPWILCWSSSSGNSGSSRIIRKLGDLVGNLGSVNKPKLLWPCERIDCRLLAG